MGQRSCDLAEIILDKPADLQLTTDTAKTPNYGLVSKIKCLLLHFKMILEREEVKKGGRKGEREKSVRKNSNLLPPIHTLIWVTTCKPGICPA